MFNLVLGTPLKDAGRSVLKTHRGQSGHAVYGPYEFLDPGSYTVKFHLELADEEPSQRGSLCAVLDVVRNTGKDVLISRKVRLDELRQGQNSFSLNFTITTRSKLEYRVWTSGAVSLVIEERRPLRRLDAPALPSSPVALLPEFPENDESAPAFFKNNYERFRELSELGFEIGFRDDGAVLAKDGIAFYARSNDDFTFIGEVFSNNVYNFLIDDPVCAIDIGMNVGFSSLQFARKENVREVFSFEPFPETYRRAVDNLGLNPGLAGKIKHFCAGLSDGSWSGEVFTGPSDDSGSQTVVARTGKHPKAVTLLDAGETLQPIIRSARERQLRVVLKVDCEGSEFAIFRSLERAQLFAEIDAIMVEWHAMFDDVNQLDLVRPLRQAGFIVFDQSPPYGNGFFYGVRLASR